MKLPKCTNIGKKGPLPPLIGAEGLTDYPEKGDNKQIDFKNSNFALFPLEVAQEIALAYPKAWCAGGNHFGNYAFEYWVRTMSALQKGTKIPDECLRWIKKRELYIARHRQDFRLAGIIAMIKWAGFIDGDGGKGQGAENGDSLAFMLDVIEKYGR
jgi:hypothetical protein